MSDQRNGFHHLHHDEARSAGPTPECAGILPLLEDLHDGVLTPDERARVAQHVAGCPFCAGKLAEYAAVDQLVRAAPAPRVDGRLRAAVYARIEDATEALAAVPTREGRLPSTRRTQAARWVNTPPATRPGTARRASRPWIGFSAAAAVVIGLTLVLTLYGVCGLKPSATGTPSVTTPSATAQATPKLAALVPAFADWRAAYLASDGKMHIASLDGRSDITSQGFLGLTNDSAFAAMSPDGHHFAYVNAPKWGNLIVYDLRSPADGSSSAVTYIGQISNVSWSPDGTRLAGNAALQAGTGIYIFPADGGTPVMVPGSQDGGPLGNANLLGWYDNAHLLAYVESASSGGAQGAVTGPLVAARPANRELADLTTLGPRSSAPYVLAAVDVQSGQARALYSASSSLSAGVVLISADHTFGIIENTANCGAPCSAQPGVGRVDFATGQTTPLPTITAATNGNLEYAGWVPGTHDVLAVAPGNANATTPLLLLDVDHDTVTTLARGIFPIVSTPDGKTLVAGDLAASRSLVNEYPLYAFAPVSAAGRRVTLTQHMVTFLGLIKTA